MIFSWVVGILIFSYAVYALFRHMKKSKAGKCAGCDVQKSCSTVDSSCCIGKGD